VKEMVDDLCRQNLSYPVEGHPRLFTHPFNCQIAASVDWMNCEEIAFLLQAQKESEQ